MAFNYSRLRSYRLDRQSRKSTTFRPVESMAQTARRGRWAMAIYRRELTDIAGTVTTYADYG